MGNSRRDLRNWILYLTIPPLHTRTGRFIDWSYSIRHPTAYDICIPRTSSSSSSSCPCPRPPLCRHATQTPTATFRTACVVPTARVIATFRSSEPRATARHHSACRTHGHNRATTATATCSTPWGAGMTTVANGTATSATARTCQTQRRARRTGCVPYHRSGRASRQ